jgi:hypothetical protein
VKFRETLTREKLSSELIYSVRHSFVEMRTTINRLDEKLSFIHLLNVTLEMFSMLTQIYILIIYGNYEFIKKFSGTLLFSSVSNGLKLIGNCLIHGMVHEEADKLLSCLDDISISKSTKSTFKEVTILLSMSRSLKFGFSIAGIMLFKKTALTSVRKLFDFSNFSYGLLKSHLFIYFFLTDFQFRTDI